MAWAELGPGWPLTRLALCPSPCSPEPSRSQRLRGRIGAGLRAHRASQWFAGSWGWGVSSCCPGHPREQGAEAQRRDAWPGGVRSSWQGRAGRTVQKCRLCPIREATATLGERSNLLECLLPFPIYELFMFFNEKGYISL